MKVRHLNIAGLQIRTMHRYGFRSEQWASIVGLTSVTPDGGPERLCWYVGFDDGVYDYWVCSEQYEFRESQ